MMDFTSEEGIMDAIDKFFHLSQEKKENYNKGLKSLCSFRKRSAFLPFSFGF